VIGGTFSPVPRFLVALVLGLASFIAQPRRVDVDVRVSAVDVNDDGIPDIVTSFSVGAALAARAFSGLTHAPLSFFFGNYRGSFVSAGF
jgi:hypothetical protein